MKYNLEKLDADRLAAYGEWQKASIQRDDETIHDRMAREKLAIEKWQDLAQAYYAAWRGAPVGTHQRILNLRDTYRIEDCEDKEDDTAQRLAVALSQAVDLLEMVTLASLSPLAIQACVKSGREALAAYRGERK